MATKAGRAAAILFLAATILFAAAGMVWYLGFNHETWSLLPHVGDHGMDAWPAICSWVVHFLYATVFLAGVVTGALLSSGRRRTAVAFLGATAEIVLCLAPAGAYLPFFWASVHHPTRLNPAVWEPVWSYRHASILVITTMVLCALFLAVTRLRRTPPTTRAAAITMPLVVTHLCLVFWILLIIIPTSNDWRPLDWQQPDLLIAFRPCRGAAVWSSSRSGSAILTGRVDGLWLRFADPRADSREVPAISIVGELGGKSYIWITTREAGSLRMRRDDPAVIRCDARWRPERVAPEPWHEVGGSSILW
jgi:hypothetical protein